MADLKREEFLKLVEKYNAGKATAEEAELLDRYYALFGDLPEVPLENRAEKRILKNIHAQILPTRKVNWIKYVAAASILIAISTGGYFLLHQDKSGQQMAIVRHDVAPFSKQAILKTGHGRTIILDSTRKGLLAQYSNTHIRQTGSDQLAYTTADGPAENTVVFDTLQVPAGGRPYHLKMADGSAVIVNVASVLRYPENFRSNHNEVELVSGEAYFQIVHNIKAPVIIRAAGQIIEDVGTEFNVNTYAEEPDNRTTLVEGAIRVNAKALIPGQQAIIQGGRLTIAIANIKQTIAWKDGYFRFSGEPIQTVMRELARWYNIEVRYEGKISGVGYYVKISRSKNISDVLKVLERTNSVHFKVEGRRVTVFGKK